MKPFLFVQNMEDAENFINLYIITDELMNVCEDYLKDRGKYPSDFGDLIGWMNY